MIEGVAVKRLNWFQNDKGRLIEILRSDDSIFSKFGQVYLSTINPGITKGWHIHFKQTDNLCCLKGKVKLVLKDSRSFSSSYGVIDDFILEDSNTSLVSIPPGLYHALQSLDREESYIVNITDTPYKKDDPDEERVSLESIEYNWEKIKV